MSLSAFGSAGRISRFALGAAVLCRAAAGVGAPFVVTQEAMLGETDALARALCETRRTPVAIDWERRLVSASEARAAAESIVRGAFAPAEIEIDEKLFQRLGLLAEGASYLDILAGTVAREPTGFYDPSARRLYVPGFIPLPEQRPALAHEIAHALQDQRVGLRRFLKMAPDGRRGLSLDGWLARQALVEGDAAVLAMEAIDPTGTFPAPWELADLAQRTRSPNASDSASSSTSTSSSSPPSPSPQSSSPSPPPTPRPPPLTPPFLRELLAFPYSEGFVFVAGVRGLAPWSAVDAIWARPPDSTAQILHPRKYERHDAPLTIDLPALPLMGDPSRLARSETLGELVVRIWLSSVSASASASASTPSPLPSSPRSGLGAALPPEVAERVADGWRGDRMAIYLPARPDKPDRLAVAGAPPAGVVHGVAAANAPAAAAGAGAALAWITAWDSDADADDFLQNVALRLAALASNGVASGALAASAGVDRPAVWHEQGGDSVFAVQRRGTLVALLLGAPERALPSLMTMLDAWTPRRAPPSRRARQPMTRRP